MPQLKAAQKALRKNVRQRVINDRWRNKLRLAIRSVQEAVSSANSEEAQKSFTAAQQTIDKAARHKVISPNKAARKKSQLQKAVTSLKK